MTGLWIDDWAFFKSLQQCVSYSGYFLRRQCPLRVIYYQGRLWGSLALAMSFKTALPTDATFDDSDFIWLLVSSLLSLSDRMHHCPFREHMTNHYFRHHFQINVLAKTLSFHQVLRRMVIRHSCHHQRIIWSRRRSSSRSQHHRQHECRFVFVLLLSHLRPKKSSNCYSDYARGCCSIAGVGKR